MHVQMNGARLLGAFAFTQPENFQKLAPAAKDLLLSALDDFKSFIPLCRWVIAALCNIAVLVAISEKELKTIWSVAKLHIDDVQTVEFFCHLLSVVGKSLDFDYCVDFLVHALNIPNIAVQV